LVKLLQHISQLSLNNKKLLIYTNNQHTMLFSVYLANKITQNLKILKLDIVEWLGHTRQVICQKCIAKPNPY